MNRKKIEVSVCAKVNLSLNILGARGKMHALDSVMASVDLTDAITVCERLDSRINVQFDGANIDQKNNSVTRAIDVLRSEFGSFGIDVFVKKNIPVCGGLGGSSADAAGTIFAIDKMFDLQLSSLRMRAMGFKVGSDVPYMLEGGFSRVLDAGETVQKISCASEFFMVIIKPTLGVDTIKCYEKFDEQNASKFLQLTDNNALVRALENGDNFAARQLFTNALQPAACDILPEIENIIALLKKVGGQNVIMSGSGSSVVGFFDKFEHATAIADSLKQSGFWAVATKTTPRGIFVK